MARDDMGPIIRARAPARVAEPVEPGGARPQPWWAARGFMTFLVLASAVPLLWPRIPPLLDLPGHMGSYHVALALADSPLLQRFYDYHWQMIGNLGVDLLIMPIGKIVGVELGVKLITLLIATLMALGFVMIACEAHRRPPATTAFALPLAYCYPLHYGFVNYCLAMALALIAFAVWLRWSRTGQFGRRAILLLLASPIIWLTHAVGWLLFGVICFAAELQRRRAAGERWPAAITNSGAACLPAAFPLVLMALGPRGSPLTASGWLDLTAIAKWVVAIARDRWMALDLPSAAVLISLPMAALLGLAGTRHKPQLAWPALALLVVYIAAPQEISGSSFVGPRAAAGARRARLLPGQNECDHGQLSAL